MKSKGTTFALVVVIALCAAQGYVPSAGAISQQEKGSVLSLPEGYYSVKTAFLYTVVPGDNLHWLAARFYGDARHWTTIYQANRGTIRNPNRLPVGLTLLIPAVESAP